MPPVQLRILLSWSMTSLVPDLHLYFTALAFARSKNTDAASSVAAGGRYRFAISQCTSECSPDLPPRAAKRMDAALNGSAGTSLVRWGSEMEPSSVRS